MKRSDIVRYLLFRTLGNFLVLFTIFGFLATFGPALYYEVTYKVASARGIRYIVDAATNVPPPPEDSGGAGEGGGLVAALVTENKEKVLTPRSRDFSIVIPKIGANSKIIENVDPSDEKTYLQSLSQGVAHAKGTVFPGMDGTTYLFAHSADNFWNVGRYNAVFYLLKELVPGDEIVVFFQDKRYNYKVSETKIVDPSEVGYLEAKVGSGETLILQTCWPPGTTWRRLLVFAKPV